MTSPRVEWLRRAVLVHSARTAVATLASLVLARLFRLPEAYWAPITTIVITQSSLGAAFAVSWQRFTGTALGAIVGGIVASHFGPSDFLFALCVFVLGLLCAVTRMDRPSYRFGGITVAIVLLVPRTGSAWRVAFHRSTEVFIGITVALLFAYVWPEEEETSSDETSDRSQKEPDPGRFLTGKRSNELKREKIYESRRL